MAESIYKIVVLGEGNSGLNKDESARLPSPSSTCETSLTISKNKLSMPAIWKKNYSLITTSESNSPSG